MTRSIKKITAITLFYMIAIGLRIYIREFKPDFFINSTLFVHVLLQGIGPLLGGLFVVKILKRPNELKLLGIGFFKSLLAISIPIVLFLIVGILNTGELDVIAPKYIVLMLVYAIFEEYGWRNYLQSELRGMNKTIKYLIITILWFVWHLNFELSIGNLIFFLVLFIGSVGIGYVADRSKSLLFAGLFHAFFNISQSELLNDIAFNQKLVILIISAFSAIVIMRYDRKQKKALKAIKTNVILPKNE